MMRLPYLFLSLCALSHSISDVNIAGTVEEPTECKACPWTLCPNKVAYDYNDAVNLTCWTEGTEIVGDNTWLKTQDNCYITQYDLQEYAGDYTTALPYCGRIPTSLTTTTAHTRYLTDCQVHPRLNRFSYDISALRHYKANIPLALFCIAPNGSAVLDNDNRTTWFKTRADCYVHESTLWDVDGKEELDDCGPVPSALHPSAHATPTETGEGVLARETGGVGRSGAGAGAGSSEHHWGNGVGEDKGRRMRKRWLYRTSVGEEYVNCTAKASNDERVPRRLYEFGKELTIQCATWGIDKDPMIFLFTTDFCYVRDWEVDPGLRENKVREDWYPNCNRFTDTDT